MWSTATPKPAPFPGTRPQMPPSLRGCPTQDPNSCVRNWDVVHGGSKADGVQCVARQCELRGLKYGRLVHVIPRVQPLGPTEGVRHGSSTVTAAAAAAAVTTAITRWRRALGIERHPVLPRARLEEIDGEIEMADWTIIPPLA